MDETNHSQSAPVKQRGPKRGFGFAFKINHLVMIDFAVTSLCRGNSE
jgi:hypothetical protein